MAFPNNGSFSTIVLLKTQFGQLADNVPPNTCANFTKFCGSSSRLPLFHHKNFRSGC